ncbi:hypothetical protein EAF00_000654 [Botryotinia globosa]|nr:hypothetical protein EAF00_000654 [Botryotinia globosa]
MEEIIIREEGTAFYIFRNPAFFPNELEAFHAGSREWYGRSTCTRKMQANAMAEAALLDAPEWICCLYREGKDWWGFVVLYNEKGFIKFVLKHNSSKNIIDTKWYTIPFNTLGSMVVLCAFVVGTTLNSSDKSNQQNDIILRHTFREIFKDPLQYKQKADVTPRTLFDRTDLLLRSLIAYAWPLFFESMRIRAFEADYPVPGKHT